MVSGYKPADPFQFVHVAGLLQIQGSSLWHPEILASPSIYTQFPPPPMTTSLQDKHHTAGFKQDTLENSNKCIVWTTWKNTLNDLRRESEKREWKYCLQSGYQFSIFGDNSIGKILNRFVHRKRKFRLKIFFSIGFQDVSISECQLPNMKH